MSEQKVIDDIKLANNGYVVFDAMPFVLQPIAMKMVTDGKLVLKRGLLHMPKFSPEFMKMPHKHLQRNIEMPDFEAAILDRDATRGYFD